MKKYQFLFLSVLLLFAACASEEVKVEELAPATTFGNLRTVDEAVIIAKEMYGLRSNSRATVDVADVAVIGSSASRSSNDTLIYAINFADNKGFTLVSAAKEGIDVIGYSDEGIFNAKEASENPAFNYYLDIAKNYVGEMVNGGTYPGGGLIPDPSYPTMKDIVSISNRINVKWGQNYPEGMSCPNGIAGCAQTAMAQLFTYIEKPTSINYTCGEFGISTETLNWSTLSTHETSCGNIQEYNRHLNECKVPSSTHSTLSRLCRELGYRNNATYSQDATGAYPSDVIQTLRTLLPSNEIVGYLSFTKPYDALFNKLNSRDCVAYIIGYATDKNDKTVGHGWICDGGYDVISTTKALSFSGEWITKEEHSYYYHFNWGWNGLHNGNFSAGVFEVEINGDKYDFGQDLSYFLVYKN